jgi:hypothetical protein
MSTDIEQRAYRLQVGSIACTIVSDGSATYHDPAQLFFEDASRAALDSALRGHGIVAETWHEHVSPYVALLIRTGHQQVLVDTGGPQLTSPTIGPHHQLADQLPN